MDSSLAKDAISFTMQWVSSQRGEFSLDDVVQTLKKRPGVVSVVDNRPLAMIVKFSDGSGVGVNRDGLDLLEPTNDAPSDDWNARDWDGMSEQEAFDEDPMEVLKVRGVEVASQSWSGGSWSTVYRYRGKYYAIDEVEMCEFDDPGEAFRRAGIGCETHDEILDMSVESGYEGYIQK